jgi:hypothetical protein
VYWNAVHADLVQRRFPQARRVDRVFMGQDSAVFEVPPPAR